MTFVHFITTKPRWRLATTLIDPSPSEVESMRAKLLASLGSIVVWFSDHDADAITERLKLRSRRV